MRAPAKCENPPELARGLGGLNCIQSCLLRLKHQLPGSTPITPGNPSCSCTSPSYLALASQPVSSDGKSRSTLPPCKTSFRYFSTPSGVEDHKALMALFPEGAESLGTTSAVEQLMIHLSLAEDSERRVEVSPGRCGCVHILCNTAADRISYVRPYFLFNVRQRHVDYGRPR